MTRKPRTEVKWWPRCLTELAAENLLLGSCSSHLTISQYCFPCANGTPRKFKICSMANISAPSHYIQNMRQQSLKCLYSLSFRTPVWAICFQQRDLLWFRSQYKQDDCTLTSVRLVLRIIPSSAGGREQKKTTAPRERRWQTATVIVQHANLHLHFV